MLNAHNCKLTVGRVIGDVLSVCGVSRTSAGRS